MILEVCWDSLWTLSFGLSQFHGHGSWLVCEVALISTTRTNRDKQCSRHDRKDCIVKLGALSFGVGMSADVLSLA